MEKSYCCGAEMLDSGQCLACGADGIDERNKPINPFDDPEHNELLDEKLKYND